MNPSVDEVTTAMVRAWHEILNPAEQMDSRSDVLDLGATSLNYVQLLGKMDEQFGVQVPVDILLAADSIRAMAEALVDHRAEGSSTGSVDG